MHQQVLEIDPGDVESLDRLIELQTQLGKWSSLLETYERKAEVVTDPDARNELFTAMGRVYETQLDDSDKAIDVYQRVLEIDPDDLAALGHLDGLFEATSQWRDLLQVLERQSELVAEAEARTELRFRIGELWRRHLEDPTQAIEIYRDILAEAPSHQKTLDALTAMTNDAVEPLAAAEALEQVYLAAGEYRLSAAVRVRNSGIVLRGEGASRTLLRGVGPFVPPPASGDGAAAAGGAPPVDAAVDLTSGGLVEFAGAGGVEPLAGSTPAPVVGDCAVGSREVRVAAAAAVVRLSWQPPCLAVVGGGGGR